MLMGRPIAVYRGSLQERALMRKQGTRKGDAKMRTIVALVLVFCLGFLTTSCSSLSPFLDTHVTDTERSQDTRANKRVPLPPTVKDFEEAPTEW
jgi:hypothetical protein